MIFNNACCLSECTSVKETVKVDKTYKKSRRDDTLVTRVEPVIQNIVTILFLAHVFDAKHSKTVTNGLVHTPASA